MNSDLVKFARAADNAARCHVDQQRKGIKAEPYINHLTEVTELLAEATGGNDVVLLLGGWLVVAPGTPEGIADDAPCELSTSCWLRTALLSGVWFGLCDSEVCSVCEKSTSIVTCARTLLAPTTGSSMSTILRP